MTTIMQPSDNNRSSRRRRRLTRRNGFDNRSQNSHTGARGPVRRQESVAGAVPPKQVESKGKWASETFDVLRLFSRVGRTIVGLFALQFAWVLALRSVAALMTAPTSDPRLTLTWPARAAGLPGATLSVGLDAIWLAGALFLTIYWAFYSGFSAYFWAPFIRFLRNLIIPSISLLSFLIFLIVLGPPALLIKLINDVRTRPAERRLRAAKAQLDQAKQSDNTEHKEEEPGTAEERKKLLAKSEEACKEAQAQLDELGYLPNPPLHWLSAVAYHFVVRPFQRWLATGEVGLAHLISHTYLEDLQADKLQPQVWVPALDQLNLQASGWSITEAISFRLLPEPFNISSLARAEFVRTLLGLDVLLWGFYIDRHMVWLNVQQNPRGLPAVRKVSILDRSDEDTKRFWGTPANDERGDDLFPPTPYLRLSSLTLDQRNSWQAHAVLVLSLILAVQNHRYRTWWPGGRKEWRETDASDSWDPLVENISVYEELLSYLAYHLLPEVQAGDVSRTRFNACEVVVPQIVSEWIGSQFADADRFLKRAARYGGYDSQSSPGVESQLRSLIQDYAWRLHEPMSRCVALLPDDPAHRYRLGAIECLLRKQDAALAQFREAARREQPWESLDLAEQRRRKRRWTRAEKYLKDGLEERALIEIRITESKTVKAKLEIKWARVCAVYARALLTMRLPPEKINEAADQINKGINQVRRHSRSVEPEERGAASAPAATQASYTNPFEVPRLVLRNLRILLDEKVGDSERDLVVPRAPQQPAE